MNKKKYLNLKIDNEQKINRDGSKLSEESN